jgi:hypothetical protein
MKMLLVLVLLGCITFNARNAAWAASVLSSTGVSSTDSGIKETTFGDLAADALRNTTNVDVTFVPSSAMRQVELSGSSLTTDEIAGVFVATTAPANAYVTMRVKGKQILSALERSVSHLPESFDGFLQVSGVKVTYNPSNPPGSRIVSVVLSDGTPLNPDSQYTAAMTQPLGCGGMGYFQAWNQSDVVKTSDDALSSVVSSYAQAHQPLNIQTDGRLNSQ